MKKLKGFSASSGIAIGVVGMYSLETFKNLPHYRISRNQIKNELKRVDNAFNTTRSSLKKVAEISKQMFGKQGYDIIAAHLTILNDAGTKIKIEKAILNRRINAEHAVEDVFGVFIEKLAKHGLHFEEISHDVNDVRDRLIESFGVGGGKFMCPIGDKEPVVVAADRLTPSMILNIPKENVMAFVTRQGGYTSHATILARTLNVPVLFGIDVEKELACQYKVIVDGTLGKVFVWPDKKTLNTYKRKERLQIKRKYFCSIKSEHPAQTAEGKRITLKVNISTLGELELLKGYDIEKDGAEKEVNYDGIGLLRTEFIFMKNDTPPDEEEQFKVYRMILDAAGDRPVAMRLLDLSPDKTPSYLKTSIQSNKIMDVRGANAVITYRDLYLTQTRAMLRAAKYGNLKILFPMIADLDDVMILKQLISEAEASLRKGKLKYRFPPLGIMFETPSSILLADSLLKEVDFSNIGTNDLLQYLVAASRENLISQERYCIMHPSVIKMILMVVEAGKRNNKEVCLCGEVGTFESYYPVLLDAGVRSFSVPAAKYEDIKCELLHISSSDYQGAVKKYLRNKTRKSQEIFFESRQ